ncbi:MAG: protein arginine kinase [Oscillospiraceae bacterium]|nr:protein arginine kinase [Oscillospiraceae bacterium]
MNIERNEVHGEEVLSEAALSEEARKEKSNSKEANSEEANSEEFNSDEARSDGARSDEADNDEAHSDEARIDEAHSDEANNEKALSDAARDKDVMDEAASEKEAHSREAPGKATPGGTEQGRGSQDKAVFGKATSNRAAHSKTASDGTASCIAMSCRIRLARNFNGFPFPSRLDRASSQKVLAMVKDAFFSPKESKEKDSKEINTSDFLYVNMQDLDPIERTMLVEKHLASPDLASEIRPCAAIISKDETVSIMINEEDHLRIQCISKSDAIDEVLEKCYKVEEVFDDKLDLAFDPNIGYLTSCPTNLGTGLRASFMLHLPALVATGHINGVLEQCGKIGVAVRGIYGENSAVSGNIFQFSNMGSLGRSEVEIVANVKNVCSQIIDSEHKLRLGLLNQNRSAFEDRVFRALGTLLYARIMTTDEFMSLWSAVRVGVDMGIIENINVNALDGLMVQVQPACLQKMTGSSISPEERDIKRATLVRNKITTDSN